ncbi:MAG TPA: MBG domain-containing protein [Acidisarcina sp.]
MTVLSCASAAAQSPAPPLLLMGTTPLVVNSTATIEVVVSDPALILGPGGQVVIDFGDNTPAAAVPLSTSRASTTHTFATAGEFKITASYSGDANFAAATTSLTAVSLVSSPVYTLQSYGDSFTSSAPTSWPVTLSAALGWPLINHAHGGYRTIDEAPYVYSSVVDATYASTWLLGQNDGGSVFGPGIQQFQSAALAQNAFLAIPEGPAKFRAQNSGVTQSGQWVASDIFPDTGLLSHSAGSSLTATVPGSTLYLGLSSTTTSDYMVDVLIDGIDQGTLSPVSAYTGNISAGDTYGMRYPLGGSQTASHTVQVVCVNPGTSGCYVDWVGGNGLARPNAPPYVFTGISYTTLQPDPFGGSEVRQNAVRAAESQLQSDGLAIRLADIAAHFSGPDQPSCLLPDGIHPAPCGQDVLKTVWLSALTFLATEAQRIDVPQQGAGIGVPLTLQGTATSGLPVTFKVISGPGTIKGNQLTADQTGTVVIEAVQAGTATVLPAAPVQSSIPVTSTPLTVTASNATRVFGAPDPAFTYTINGLINGDTASSAISGTPAFSTTATATSPAGLYTITPSLGTLTSPNYSFTNFVSGTLTITDYSLAANPGTLTIKAGKSGSMAVTLTPLFGYQGSITLSCGSLPAHVTCTPTPATLAADGSGNPVQASITIHTAGGPNVNAVLRDSGTHTELAAFLWLPGATCGLLLLFNRRRLMRAGPLYLGAMLLALLLGLMGAIACGTGTFPDAAVGTSVITINGTSGGTPALAHSAQLTINVN